MDLSPEAQAVLDASRKYTTQAWSDATHQRFRLGISAALLAVADQIWMKQPLEDTDVDYGIFAAHNVISTSLLAIAAELETAQ